MDLNVPLGCISNIPDLGCLVSRQGKQGTPPHTNTLHFANKQPMLQESVEVRRAGLGLGGGGWTDRLLVLCAGSGCGAPSTTAVLKSQGLLPLKKHLSPACCAWEGDMFISGGAMSSFPRKSFFQIQRKAGGALTGALSGASSGASMMVSVLLTPTRVA